MKYSSRWILLCCSIAVLTACNQEKTAQEHIGTAKDYLDRQELQAATLELKNALLQEKDSLEARWLLGKVYYQLGDYESAEKELLRARELGIDYQAVAALLAQSYLKQGKQEALQALGVEGLAPPVAAEVRALQARGFLTRGQLQEAGDYVRLAESLDAKAEAVKLARAWLFFTRQEIGNARRQVQALLEENAQHAEAWHLLGDIEVLDKQPGKAEEAFTEAIDHSVANTEIYLKRLMVRVQLKKFDLAQADIEVVKSRGERFPGLYYAEGLLHYRNQELKAAQESFEQALRAKSNFPSARLFAGVVHLLQGNLEQADYYAGQYHAQVPRSAQGRKLLAMVRKQQQDFAAVEALLQPVISQTGGDLMALNLLAEAKLNLGKKKQGVALLEKAAAMNPGSAAADYRLGLGYLLEGDQAVGVDHIQSALELDPAYQQADIALVMHHLGEQDYQSALQAAQDYRGKNPDIAMPYNLMGGVYLAMGEADEAKNAFEKALDKSPGNASAAHNLAGIYLRNGEYDKARAIYEDVLQVHENNLTTLLLLASLDKHEQKEALMVEHLQTAIAAYPDAVRPRAVLASHYLQQGRSDKVRELLAGQQTGDQLDAVLLRLLAQAHLQAQQYAEAQFTLEKLIAQAPESAEGYFLLSRVFAEQDNMSATKKALGKAVSLAPDYLPPRLVLTRLQLKEGALTAAQQQLDSIAPAYTELPAVIELRAELLEAQGKADQAERLLEQLFVQSPTTGRMMSLARAKWSRDQAQAIELIASWVDEHPQDVRARMELANAYYNAGQEDASIAEYKAILERDKDNLIALNNLAWYYRETNPPLSLEYVLAAEKLQPDSANIKDTLSVVLLNNGQLEKARSAIDFALDRMPDNPTFQYHSALIDYKAGNQEAALQALDGLLSKNVEFAEKAQAQALYKKIRARL